MHCAGVVLSCALLGGGGGVGVGSTFNTNSGPTNCSWEELRVSSMDIVDRGAEIYK